MQIATKEPIANIIINIKLGNPDLGVLATGPGIIRLNLFGENDILME